MQRVLASFLALGLAATGTASAQSYGGYDGYPAPTSQGYSDAGGYYDYARVVRVDPVIRSGYRQTSGTRCYSEQGSYAGGYGNDGTYRNDGYGNGGYRDGGYNRGYGGGSTVGRNVATIVGGVVGAALGSRVGGGSARYATSAIGSMVGGMAGRQVYDNAHQPARVATVQVCDPVQPGQSGYSGSGYYGDNSGYYGSNTGDYGNGYDASAVDGYDVTYEYAGRTYTTRTRYNPGNRIRIRVDVHPE